MKVVKLLLALMTFCFAMGVSQAAEKEAAKYYPAVVVKKDGTKDEGFMTVGYFGSASYGVWLAPVPRKSKEDKFYASSDVSQVYLNIEEGSYLLREPIKWVYANFYVKNNYKHTQDVFALVLEKGDLELYAIYYEGYKKFTNYYCKKKGEEVAGLVAIVECNRNGERCDVSDHFEASYKHLFGDYPDLCKQIEEEKLTGEHLPEIVKEYNRYKAEKKIGK